MTAARVLRNDPAIEAARDAAPERFRTEIINGALNMCPAPRILHQYVAVQLSVLLAGASKLRRRRRPDGTLPPGGWHFVAVPELHLGPMPDMVNPDLAGWRSERAPPLTDIATHVVPDWICEVLSPSTETYDRGTKLPMFAGHGVSHAWLVDPEHRRLEVYRLDRGVFREIARYERDDVVNAEPFDELPVPLSDLWE